MRLLFQLLLGAQHMHLTAIWFKSKIIDADDNSLNVDINKLRKHLSKKQS